MNSSSNKLPRSFYNREDVVQIARDLLGKVLCTCIGGQFTSGMIVETEAYRGISDKACHACVYGETKRTKVMFGEPGHAYIYLCYGIHHLFNIVTNKKGYADAVLIRGIEPIDGIEAILKRRGKSQSDRSTGAGPGNVSKALGITTSLYGTDLLTNTIWLEDRNIELNKTIILESPRVGVAYAGDDASLPWRFRIKRSGGYTSMAK